MTTEPDAREFLEQLEQQAAVRAAAAVKVPRNKRCKQCSGTGSVTRYVLPGVTGPDKCKGCNGSGRGRP